MANRKIEENVLEDSNGSIGGKKKGGIIAFIICVFIALAIWTYAKNAEIKNENNPEGDGQTTEIGTAEVGE